MLNNPLPDESCSNINKQPSRARQQADVHDWITHLETRYPTRPVKLGLSRIESVAQRLALKPLQSVVVTVAGTNGKGSTVAALEAVYLAAGYQVGAYTSPHLLQFNERIRLNGQVVSDSLLLSAFKEVHEAEAGLQCLTYFEFITLAALWIFKQASLDLVILEVGLGGRLDATNIIDADLAILTTIDFDHQTYLGDTREAIGYEKAGILRARQHCIFASEHPPQSVLDVAKQLEVQLHRLGRDYGYDIGEKGELLCWAKAQPRRVRWNLAQHVLHPEALCAAMMTTHLLQGRLGVKAEALSALERVSLAGRLQRLPGEIEVLVDVAHNEQSVRRLSAFLKAQYRGKKVIAVFSALKDKAIPQMLLALSNQVQVWHVACLEDRRAADQAQLQGAFSNYPEKQVLWYNSISSAFLGAKTQARPRQDLVLVFGSFLTVAAVLKAHTEGV